VWPDIAGESGDYRASDNRVAYRQTRQDTTRLHGETQRAKSKIAGVTTQGVRISSHAYLMCRGRLLQASKDQQCLRHQNSHQSFLGPWRTHTTRLPRHHSTAGSAPQLRSLDFSNAASMPAHSSQAQFLLTNRCVDTQQDKSMEHCTNVPSVEHNWHRGACV
jgi:hypothetical protein